MSQQKRAVGKAFQVVMAGGGFFAGYVWGVARWAGGTGQLPDPLVRSSLLPGGFLAGLYALFAVTLFWPWIPVPKVSGLRAVVFPVVFSVSLVAGALGIQAALWVLG